MKFDIIGRRTWWFIISALLLAPGLVSMVVQGFNLGIDFTGGTLLDLNFSQPVSVAQVRDVLEQFDLDKSMIQLASESKATEAATNVIIRTRVLTETERQEVLAGLNQLGSFDILRIEKVGATIGSELTRQAILALAVAALMMIVYITFRFEFKFAVSAILALLHDVFIVLGVFSIWQLEVDSSFVAALLTIVGYSINDTIVIFDRIRENLKGHRKGESLAALVNRSIWQTVMRSLYTGVSVLFCLAALILFGGETTKNFALAMFIGVLAGTYSSIFFASPVWVTWHEYSERRRIALKVRGAK